MQLLLYSTLVESEKETLNSEKFYQNKIIDNFNNIEIFKNYIFIENEKKLNDGDKIDIFAKTKDNNRPIIIELKIKNKSGRKQLRSYATHFDNPILINISEEYPSNITEDIIYLTYKDLQYIMEYITSERIRRLVYSRNYVDNPRIKEDVIKLMEDKM